MPDCLPRSRRGRRVPPSSCWSAAPRDFRGGNSRHTRNLRCAHAAPTDVLTDAYPEDELMSDLLKVNGNETDEALARLVVERSAACPAWMRTFGVRFQASLRGTLHLSRTNAFFLGGGKALMNSYYAAAERLGVRVRVRRRSRRPRPPRRHVSRRGGVDCRSHRNCSRQGCRRGVRRVRGEPRVAARSMGRGRRQFHRPWHAVQQGHDPPDAARCRGAGDWRSRANVTPWPSTGAPRNSTGASSRGWTRCRSASRSTSIGERFYDEGEDFWPKRYAIWGKLVARQPAQIAYSIVDAKVQRTVHAVGVSARSRRTRSANWRRCWVWRPTGSRPPWPRSTAPSGRARSITRRSTTAVPRDSRRRRPTGRNASTRRRSGGTRCGPGSRSRISACEWTSSARVLAANGVPFAQRLRRRRGHGREYPAEGIHRGNRDDHRDRVRPDRRGKRCAACRRSMS